MSCEDGLFSRYWKAYGGFHSIFRSWFFWGAFLLTLLLYPKWSVPGWWDLIFTIMPGVLGFSLGGFAVWLSFGDQRFKNIIAGVEDGDDGVSPFMEVNAAFCHFIVLQLLSIFAAIIASAYDITLSNDNIFIVFLGEYFHFFVKLGFFIGFFIFIYSLLTALSAVLALFRVASWYDLYITGLKCKERSDGEGDNEK
ncbi:hypothetical protein [Oceanimonas smirnovii]|uniref:hypothetical protein n=1 Tax=Oceanimonas smirnovii TaxID=264574 RepID=UPI003FD32A67